MEDTQESAQTPPPVPEPSPALRQLDKLVGTWQMNGRDYGDGGAVTGRVRFEWMEGGYYLLQHVDLVHGGQPVKGIEIIGYERPFGAEAPNADCTSRFFGNTGEALTYVYDVEDDTITIWGGERGAPAAFKGKFSEDRNTITGAWQWPGGGYEATMTKVKSA